MRPTNTTRDPFLKNKINSSLGFETRPSSNLDLLPRTRTGSSDLPKLVPMVFLGANFCNLARNKKGSWKGTNGFNLEKMGSSLHFMRGKQSKVAIFWRHKVPNYNRKPIFFYVPICPKISSSSSQIWLIPPVHDCQPTYFTNLGKEKKKHLLVPSQHWCEHPY